MTFYNEKTILHGSCFDFLLIMWLPSIFVVVQKCEEGNGQLHHLSHPYFVLVTKSTAYVDYNQLENIMRNIVLRKALLWLLEAQGEWRTASLNGLTPCGYLWQKYEKDKAVEEALFIGLELTFVALKMEELKELKRRNDIDCIIVKASLLCSLAGFFLGFCLSCKFAYSFCDEMQWLVTLFCNNSICNLYLVILVCINSIVIISK